MRCYKIARKSPGNFIIFKLHNMTKEVSGMKYHSLSYVSDLIGVSNETLSRKIRDGHFIPVMLDGKKWITDDSLQCYLKGIKPIKHPDLVPNFEWSKLTRELLPAKCTVTDIDSVVLSPGGCIRLVEIKKRGDTSSFPQRYIYRQLSNGMYLACETTGMPPFNEGTFNISTTYAPMELVFQNTSFDDGMVWLDGLEVTKEELGYHLMFGDDCCSCFPDECERCGHVKDVYLNS